MTELRDEIAQTLAFVSGRDWQKLSAQGDCGRWLRLADAVADIPRIKEALAFHESCQQCFAVNGEFVVTEANVKGAGGVSAS